MAKTESKAGAKWVYEYDFALYSGDILKQVGEKIFTCAPDGVCQQTSAHPAAKILTDYLNERGARGWELVQLFPQQRGILYLFKKIA